MAFKVVRQNMSARIITNWKVTYTPWRVDITTDNDSQNSHVEDRIRKRRKLYRIGERRRTVKVRRRGEEVIEDGTKVRR